MAKGIRQGPSGPLGIQVNIADSFGDVAAPRWSEQATWFVNLATGDDEALGDTVDNPIATLDELRRRLWGAILQQDTTITLAGFDKSSALDLTPDQFGYLVLENVRMAPTFVLTIQAAGSTRAGIVEGTLSGATSLVAATSTKQTVTDAAASFTADLIGKRIRLTSGAASGATATVLAVDSGTQLNTSLFFAPSSFQETSPVFPAGTEDYVVEDLLRVRGIDVDVKSVSPGLFTLTDNSYLLQLVDVRIFNPELDPDSANQIIARDTAGDPFPRVMLRDSIVDAGQILGSFLLKNVGLDGIKEADVVSIIGGGSARGTLNLRGTTEMSAFCSVGAAGHGINVLQGGAVTTNVATNAPVVGVWDQTGAGNAGVNLESGARFFTKRGLVFGDGNAGFGIRVEGAAIFAYENAAQQPVITGSVGDTQIDAATVAYAAIPTFTATSASGVVEQT